MDNIITGRVVHPTWCDLGECRVIWDTDEGEHRGRVYVLDTSTVQPRPTRRASAQLVQEAGIAGGATVYLVLQLGAERWAIPVGTARAIVDLVVPLLWAGAQERTEYGVDVVEAFELARGAVAAAELYQIREALAWEIREADDATMRRSGELLDRIRREREADR